MEWKCVRLGFCLFLSNIGERNYDFYVRQCDYLPCVCVCFKWRAREIYSRCLYSRLLYGVSSIISTVAVHRTSPLSCSTALQLCLWSVTPRWHNIQHTGVLWTNTSKQVAKQKNPDFAFKRGEKNREMD